ncbi:protein kinase domain-containing protein [Crocosphaera chwakensis]|uniref:WD-40 repeat protein n=1 Tax=Crocosphaera chwakensis CCY0110 TaxID=391612 RepID=A3IX04_9CHRO|nr:protein kinase [Crocosphaera chwakensis]EAZ89003.1 WD-40 repeat protein [Crocosphaera chwakensis CCY0110]
MRCLNCHLDNLPETTQLCPNCGAQVLSLLQEVLPQGTQLRSHTYCLDNAMGKGSFGITYRAHHTALKNPVAIKEFYPVEYVSRNIETKLLIIPAKHQDVYKRSLYRFLQEGQILAKLNHPNVVKVRDLFEERGTAYIVMELVQGKTLLQELENQPNKKLSPQRIEKLIEQLVNALTTIHEAGIYHLDLKPENMILTPTDQLILIDFGAATLADDAKRKRTRSFTECYAAPEIMSGGEVGPQSDLFEVGMILHELLTGKLPPPAMTRVLETDTWQPQGLDYPWDMLIVDALRIQRSDRSPTVDQWWESRKQKEGDIIRIDQKSIENLQGKFILPLLQQQGMVHKLGQGCIRKVIPINQNKVLVIEAGGASLLNINNRTTHWEIDCPSSWGDVSKNKKLLALVWQQNIYLWDLTQGKFLRQLQGHSKKITGLAFNKDGSLLLSGSLDETLIIWEIKTGTKRHELSEPMGRITAVAFSEDNQFIASGSHTGIVRIWGAISGQEWRCLEGHGTAIESLIFSSDSKVLASGGRDKTIHLWNVTSGKSQQVLEGHQDWVTALSFNQNADKLASASTINDKTIRIWSVAKQQQTQQLKGHTNSIQAIAFCPDDRYLISAASDNTIRLWDRKTGKAIKQLQQHTNWVYSVACSPDGRWIAIGYNDWTVRLWDIIEQREVNCLEGHESSVSSVAFCPDNQHLISGSWDGTLRVWDIHTGKCKRILQDHQNWISSVAVSPNGQWVASGGWDKTVHLWEIAYSWTQFQATKPTRILQGHLEDIEGVAFSPNSQLVASCGNDKTIKIWEVVSGQQVQQLEGHKYSVEDVVFSPDGQFIASVSRDKTVRVWHIISGKEVHKFQGHTNYVYCVAFSLDGHYLISGGKDKMIAIWDLISGELTQLMQGHTNDINSIAFTGDGSFLVSGDNDGVVRLWKLQLENGS